MRPDFIPKEEFRAYKKAYSLNKLARVGGIQVGSYIQKWDKLGAPVTSKEVSHTKHYRMLDVVAHARARGLEVTAPDLILETQDLFKLRTEKDRLSVEIASLKHDLALNTASLTLTGATLLTEKEIVDYKLPIPETSGVYFLIDGASVVYVGQSVSVPTRVREHLGVKKFDGFAYIPCDRESLNVIESLYIHVLRPKLNGGINSSTPGLCAPLRLDQLLVGKPKVQGRLRNNAKTKTALG